ncbi:MAG: DNA-directed RNA polymerase subunit H [Nanobdellota archaeon]
MAKKSTFDISKHMLVPKHTKLSQKDKKALLDEKGITFANLPKISIKDPALSSLSVKDGDVIKIERDSPTSKTTIYYRGVTSE